MDQERPMQGSHSVEIDPRCELAPMVGGRQPLVNSLHHQGVEDPGPDLRAVAWAPDGLIEAVELPGNRFFYGVQWHPELLGVDAPTFGMFAAFVQACDRDAADGHTAASDGRARATGAAAARQTRSK
jgi:putative glutamine amidotransferase